MAIEIDILLVNAKTRDIPPAYPPHGLLSIASFLRENGYEVQIYDRNAEKADYINILRKYNPKVVGISCLSGPVINDAIYISRTTKENSNALTVWGGLHPTLFSEQVLKEEYVDFVIIGEGEITTLELLQNLNIPDKYASIKGLAYKINGNIKYNSPRGFVENLDEMPIEAWDLLDIKKYYQKTFYADKCLVLHTSRGCPYRCAYCYNTVIQRRKWRGRSASKIIEEIGFLKYNYNIDGVHFFDDNFDANKKRIEEFCRKLKEEKLDVKWHYSARVNSATKDHLKMIKESNCELIEFGVESGSQRILDFICKDQTIQQSKQAFENCKSIGIKANALFMIGVPTETIDELNTTIKFITSLPFYQTVCSIYKPYPGTQLFQYCIQNNLLKLPQNLEEIGELYSYSSANLNMSKIPSEILISVQDIFWRRNVINEVKTCFEYRNFRLLNDRTMTHLNVQNIKILVRSIIGINKQRAISYVIG